MVMVSDTPAVSSEGPTASPPDGPAPPAPREARLEHLIREYVKLAEERISMAYIDGFNQAIGKRPWDDMHDFAALHAKDRANAYVREALNIYGQSA